MKFFAVLMSAFLLFSCSKSTSTSSDETSKQLTGAVKLDGSSTVFPVSEAMAEEFQKLHPRVRVTVGVSGTGGGFKKFLMNEIHINNASRKIKKIEKDKALASELLYFEVPVAYDGITIVVNKANTWVDYLSVEELNKIWKPGSQVKTWKDVRPSWPAEKIKLFGPGTDSGTFDYFTEAINGKEQASRSDFTKSEDDNVLVKGVSGEKNSLGYFGFAYFKENQDKVKAVPVANKGSKEAVVPNYANIQSGKYAPLSRMVFIYVSKEALKEKAVLEFTKFYLSQATSIVSEVGFIALPEKLYQSLKSQIKPGKIQAR